MSYIQLKDKIDGLYSDLELATSSSEKNYFEMEILVAEEILEDTINKGRR